jgi:hypothetical protein
MDKIMSFDVSSVCTGWSLLENGSLKEFGLIKMSNHYTIPEKLYWFKNNVRGLLKIHKPNHVVVEETYLKNVKTLKTLMQFISIVNLETFNILGIEPVFINTMTVRSHFGLKDKIEVFNYLVDNYKTKLKYLIFDEGGNDITDSLLQALYWNDKLKEKKDE